MNCFGSMMEKATLNKKMFFFIRKLEVNFRKKPVKRYIWSIALCGNWTLSEIRSEIPGKY